MATRAPALGNNAEQPLRRKREAGHTVTVMPNGRSRSEKPKASSKVQVEEEKIQGKKGKGKQIYEGK